MSNSNFDKNGVDKSGTHWLQYAAFVVTAFATYFGWDFAMIQIFIILLQKYLSSGIAMDITQSLIV